MRDRSIDIYKGLLIIGMIYAHTLQLLGGTLSPIESGLSFYVNAVTFPGFFFCYGYTTYLAYITRREPAIMTKMLASAWRALAAFYFSGVFWRILVDAHPFSWQAVFKILLLFDIPPYSEFLVAFALIIGVSIPLRGVLHRLSLRDLEFWICLGILTLTWFFPYHLVKSTHLGLFVGTYVFYCFPILQYAPFFLLGQRYASKQPRFSWFIIVTTALLAIPFFATWSATGTQPSRFPPSPEWMLLPTSVVIGYRYLSRLLEIGGRPAGWIESIGRNALVYLLTSNLILFGLTTRYRDALESPYLGLLTAAGILMFIYFLGYLTLRSTSHPSQKPGF